MPTAIVTTINKNAQQVSDVVTGKIVTADPAAAANISIGFIPSRVEIFNYTNPSQHNWQKGMAAGYCEQQVTAGDKTVVTTGGISEYEGSDSAAPGFTIGTDAVLNTAGDTLYFKAYR